MPTKKRDLRGWRLDAEREKGRATMPTDYAAPDPANAHFDASAEMSESELWASATATVATHPALDLGERLDGAMADSLPGYRAASLLEQTRVLDRVRGALDDFAADRKAYATRPTAGDVLHSLGQVSGALAALTAAWDGTDPRSQEIVYIGLGDGHDGGPTLAQRMERARARVQRSDMKGTEDLSPPDAFSAGVRRLGAFLETAQEIAKAIARGKPKRDPVRAEYNGLIARLAAIYVAFTDLPITNSDSRKSPRHFVGAIIAEMPGQKPRPATITRTIARIARHAPNSLSP